MTNLDEIRHAMNRLRAQASRSGSISTSEVFRETDIVMDAISRADGPVKVKPLEWHNDGTLPHFMAATIIGNYFAYPNGSWTRPGEHIAVEGTIETAKAAAQADYEPRIRSALAAPHGNAKRG